MYNRYDIKEIRFLPMSDSEFKTEDDVREYLLNVLPKMQEGRYWYQSKGIDLKNTEALILFQYAGTLIGCGIFYGREKFSKPKQDNGFTYHGINLFYPETIFNIANITGDEFKIIDDTFNKFGQGMRNTNIKYLSQILELVENKWKEYR